MSVSPPRPVLTLRLGVTGHRPNKLDRASVDRIASETEAFMREAETRLAQIRRENAQVYSAEGPKLRLLSALAEGADCFVAFAGLRQGFELAAMLPFARDDYIRDFVTEEARRDYATLLDRAAVVVEADGRYEAEEARTAAYRSVGESVVQHSDLLIAVWDGEAASGRGGTGDIVDYARRTECPVIWFPSNWDKVRYYGDLPRLLFSDRSVVRDVSAELARVMTGLFAAPAVEPSSKRGGLPWLERGAAASPLTRYFAETRTRWAFAGRFFGGFQSAVTAIYRSWRGLKTRIATLAGISTVTGAGAPEPPERSPPAAAAQDKGGDPAARSAQRWKDQLAKVMSAPGFHDKNLERLAAHYAWLDYLAAAYAGLYRSAYLMNYLLAAAAIMAAATFSHGGAVVELVLIFLILMITLLGRRRRWHQRWIEYREVAEELRTLRYLRLVASPPAVPRLPKHLDEPAAPAAWTRWLYQAIVRECGLPAIRFRPDYLERVRANLVETEIADQVDYHHRNSRHLHDFDHALHLISVTAFLLTFAVALTHLVWTGFLLNYLTLTLPTIGAAMFAIRNQGEFIRLSERSERMEAALRTLGDDLTQSAGATVDRQELEAKAQELATTMLSETSHWKIVFRGRPLDLPA